MRVLVKRIAVFLLLVFVLFISACVTHKVNDRRITEPMLPKEIVLINIRKAIDPSNKFQSYHTLEAEILKLRIYSDYPIRIAERYTYEQDKSKSFSYLKLKKSEVKGNNFREEATITGTCFEGKYETDMTDNIEELSEFIQNTFPEKTKSFAANLFFNLLSKPLEYKMAGEKSVVGGLNCYKIMFVLDYRYFDSSNKLIYYIDDKNFLPVKIETDYAEIENIEYKNIDGINLFYKFKIVNSHLNNEATYWEVKKFSLNHQIDISDKLPKIKGKQL